MQQVFSTTTSASSSDAAATSPSASSRPPMRSESCSFIWHPKVRIRNVRSIPTRLPRRTAGRRSRHLSGELGGADLADDRDLDLAGVLQFLLDLLRDVARDDLRLEIIDGPRLHEDAHLAPGLHRVDLLDAAERVADLLEALEPLHVGLERFASCAGPA